MEKAERLVAGLSGNAASRIKLLNGDITQPLFGLSDDVIQELNGKVDLFYHIAALVKFDEELRDELVDVNYGGTENALELAKLFKVKQFIYISTAYTVGKRSHGVESLYPIDANVHNPYEESKVKSEHLAFSYSDCMDVSHIPSFNYCGDSEHRRSRFRVHALRFYAGT